MNHVIIACVIGPLFLPIEFCPRDTSFLFRLSTGLAYLHLPFLLFTVHINILLLDQLLPRSSVLTRWTVRMETPEHLPNIGVLAAVFDSDESYIVAICMGTRFDIEVRAGSLKGSSYFDEYTRLAIPLDESDFEDKEEAVEAMLDWIYRPLHTQFVAIPPIDPCAITLQRRFFPPSIHVELVVVGSALTAKAVDDREIRFATEGMIELKEDYASLDIPRIKASDITVVAAHHNDNPTCDPPQRVRTKDGILRLFKDCTLIDQTRRELEIASRIRELGLYKKLRVSCVHGIAISDNGGFMLGLLSDLIPTKYGDLYYPEL